MRIVIAFMVVLGSVTLTGGSASASDYSDCQDGDQDACERYAYDRCVRRLRREGFTRSEARAYCRT